MSFSDFNNPAVSLSQMFSADSFTAAIWRLISPKAIAPWINHKSALPASSSFRRLRAKTAKVLAAVRLTYLES